MQACSGLGAPFQVVVRVSPLHPSLVRVQGLQIRVAGLGVGIEITVQEIKTHGVRESG